MSLDIPLMARTIRTMKQSDSKAMPCMVEDIYEVSMFSLMSQLVPIAFQFDGREDLHATVDRHGVTLSCDEIDMEDGELTPDEIFTESLSWYCQDQVTLDRIVRLAYMHHTGDYTDGAVDIRTIRDTGRHRRHVIRKLAEITKRLEMNL